MDEMPFIALTGSPFLKRLYQSKPLKFSMTDKTGNSDFPASADLPVHGPCHLRLCGRITRHGRGIWLIHRHQEQDRAMCPVKSGNTDLKTTTTD
ncbi:hypothetical protein ABGB17_15640 [Sphaerisporangium sp. B11E5]|uniref:hypothetical protein n=1 Tax=Sphaerisporangium sp. B11E5 TaxID=3153563 RepID=UPI00325E631A